MLCYAALPSPLSLFFDDVKAEVLLRVFFALFCFLLYI